jgi:aerobic carbon-monoxide dehydrogenase medium subunit
VKPAPFRYHRPTTVAEAVEVLAGVKDHGKVLAGGQSLIPLLSMRLAAPTDLIDISSIPELSRIDITDVEVVVGAGVRHEDLLRHGGVKAVAPIIWQALSHVAHPVIRNRGTTVGSIVHADPSGEMTAVLRLCGGSLTVASVTGTRSIPAADLFVGPLESSLLPGEIAISAHFPLPAPNTTSAFVEVARRHGDYALCGVGVMLTRGSDGSVVAATGCYISVSPTPLLIDFTPLITGEQAQDVEWDRLGSHAQSIAEPDDDIHASAEYRRQLIHTVTVRAFRQAAERAVA